MVSQATARGTALPRGADWMPSALRTSDGPPYGAGDTLPAEGVGLEVFRTALRQGQRAQTAGEKRQKRSGDCQGGGAKEEQEAARFHREGFCAARRRRRDWLCLLVLLAEALSLLATRAPSSQGGHANDNGVNQGSGLDLRSMGVGGRPLSQGRHCRPCEGGRDGEVATRTAFIACDACASKTQKNSRN